MTITRGAWSILGCLLIVAFTHLGHHQVIGEEQQSSNYYTAAVVEFTPTYEKNDSSATLRLNRLAYIGYIEEASQRNADIIVFPEDGLTSLNIPHRSQMDSWATVIPSALDNYVPCIEDRIEHVSETLKELSCAARKHRIYVVVNIAEKEFCEPNGTHCPNGVVYHNTNVAFDRTGKIVARYRKVNLYMESSFDTTEIPEIVTFDTDFGVTFGTFICFDILFQVPALNLTRSLGVSNFVYSTAWFSETPFLTAVQTQFAWAYAANANLLASGYHDPRRGNAGSGIYLGRKGMANATMTSSPKHRLLISRVPKSNEPSSSFEQEKYERPEELAESKQLSQQTIDSIHLLHDNLTRYVSLPFKHSINGRLCYKDFCCDFDVDTDADIDTGDPQARYHAMIYDGIRLAGKEVEIGVRVCGVVQCTTDSVLSCGFPKPSNTTFTTLNITAIYDDYSEILVTPTLLDHSLLPIQSFTTAERTIDAQTYYSLTMTRPTKNLVTFAVYARVFDRDINHRS